MSNRLYPFQRDGSCWLAARKVAVLADDMGLGKTIQTISAADLIAARWILIVAPAIALDMWAREIAIWSPGRSVQIIRSSADARNLHGDVLIVSYSLLNSVLAALRARRHDLLICDEAQSLKSIDATRTRAVYARTTGLIHVARRVWLLSGTLAPNHPGELWTPYRTLFRGPLTYEQFIARYCLVTQTAFGEQITGANLDRHAELAAFLGPHILQRRQQDVLPELPALRWGHTVVTPADVPPMPDLTIQEQAILGRLEHNEALSVIDQMHLATLRRWVGAVKAPAVVELIRAELEAVEKIVVFAVHRQTISTFAAGLGPIAATIDGDTPRATRQGLIDAFQNSSMPRVLILQIHVAGAESGRCPLVAFIAAGTPSKQATPSSHRAF